MAGSFVAALGATSAAEAEKYRTGAGPDGEEELVEHGLFYTNLNNTIDAARRLGKFIADAPGRVNQIDGFENDDSYRRSRYLIQNAIATQDVNLTNLRENSLARQLQSKRDQPATIRLIRRRRPEELQKFDVTEGKVPWVNLIPPNTKFFLEQVQESREEKVQVIDTFGEWIAFFFGRKPEVYSYAGTLLNAENHNWKNEFQQNYDEFLRGSQAVKNRATVFLQYDDVIVEGYILNTTIQMTGEMNHAVPFSFSVLVISRTVINPEALLQLRFERSGGSRLEAELFGQLQDTLDLTLSGEIGDLETYIIMREYFSGHYLPGAGISRYRINTTNLDAGQSFPPGQIGGTRNDQVIPGEFTQELGDKLAASGAGTLGLPLALEEQAATESARSSIAFGLSLI